MSMFTDTELDVLTQNMTADQKASFHSQFAGVKKKRSTALALAILPIVGPLGFGRFYLGQTGLGVLHIALCAFALVPGIIYWVVDMFLIGKACDEYNRERARQLAVQIKALG